MGYRVAGGAKHLPPSLTALTMTFAGEAHDYGVCGKVPKGLSRLTALRRLTARSGESVPSVGMGLEHLPLSLTSLEIDVGDWVPPSFARLTSLPPPGHGLGPAEAAPGPDLPQLSAAAKPATHPRPLFSPCTAFACMPLVRLRHLPTTALHSLLPRALLCASTPQLGIVSRGQGRVHAVQCRCAGSENKWAGRAGGTAAVRSVYATT